MIWHYQGTSLIHVMCPRIFVYEILSKPEENALHVSFDCY